MSVVSTATAVRAIERLTWGDAVGLCFGCILTGMFVPMFASINAMPAQVIAQVFGIITGILGLACIAVTTAVACAGHIRPVFESVSVQRLVYMLAIICGVCAVGLVLAMLIS